MLDSTPPPTLKTPKTLIEFFHHPSKWCKGAYARDSRGNSCEPLDDKANQWDLMGAMQLVYDKPVSKLGGYKITQPLWLRLVEVINELGFERIRDFNDDPETEFSDIIKVIQDAGL